MKLERVGGISGTSIKVSQPSERKSDGSENRENGATRDFGSK
jgi:hypothetical protein